MVLSRLYYSIDWCEYIVEMVVVLTYCCCCTPGYFCSDKSNEIRVYHQASKRSKTTLSTETGLLVWVRNQLLDTPKPMTSEQMHNTMHHAVNGKANTTSVLDLMRVLVKNKQYMKFMEEKYGKDFVKTLEALKKADAQLVSALSSLPSSPSTIVDGLKKAVTKCERDLVKAVKDAMKKVVKG